MMGKRLLLALLFLLGMALFLYFENNSITTSRITVSSTKLPQGFDGYRVVHLSDLQSKTFGKNQKPLVKKIIKAEPDLIVFTGDLVDSKHYNEAASLELMEKIVPIAPVYFVTGNHEWWSGKFNSLENKLSKLGVKVMRNTSESLTRGGDRISIAGVDDPDSGFGFNTVLKETQGLKGFKILLSHRPELFSLYSKNKIDLIFSGHAHGGQVRIPFIGGVVAPDQGFFPEYTSGKYINGSSAMVVSRGLGNSIIPQRIFNRPEIIVVTL